MHQSPSKIPRLLRFKTLAFILAFSPCTAAFAQKAADRPQIQYNAKTGQPQLLTFAAANRPAAASAPELLLQQLHLSGSNEYRAAKTTRTPTGFTYVRYAQYFQNLPVAHGVFTAAVRDNQLYSLTGNFIPTSNLGSATPVLTEKQALDKALAVVKADRYAWEETGLEQLERRRTGNPAATTYPKGSLAWVEDFSSGRPGGMLHLAYKFTVAAAKPVSTDELYIDASTGTILLRNPLLKHITGTGTTKYSGNVSIEVNNAPTGSQYILEDYTRGSGVFTGSAGNTTGSSFSEIYSSSTNFPSNIAIDAHWGAEKVYDYWWTKQGRSSYDDMGSGLFSLVNWDVAYDNAFWNGSYMAYGDGSGIANGGFSAMAALDVCAHEIGHGVCQETCNLIYQGESGAMNEGFSDIWGATIESWADPHENDAVAKDHWTMGEELGASPMRSMKNPKLYGHPSTYGGQNWVNTLNCYPTSTNDQCGVHTNSGVLNHWYYLLAEGGSGINDFNTAYAVPGLGLDSAAAIAYATELSLYSYAEYIDAYTASVNVATQMYGPCSKGVEAVKRAWQAVGVGNGFVPCTPQISFSTPVQTVSENVAGGACPASKTVQIPVQLTGPAITSGSVTATLNVTGGTAVSGTDYTLTTPTVTFTSGTAATQYAVLTVFDNGDISADKDILLSTTLTQNTSNATLANVLASTRVVLQNNESAPDLGGPEQRSVGTGSVLTNLTSPFQSSASGARTQYLISVAELQAAGVRPNTPLTALAFNVTQKASNQPFNGYTIKLAHTTSADLQNDFAAGNFTTVYSGNYTTVNGWNSLPFGTSFVWNGTQALAVEICFSSYNGTKSNDRVQGFSVGSYVTAFSTGSWGPGCSLPHNAGGVSFARPVFRFTQQVAPTAVETVSGASRTWSVRTGQNVYFYAAATDKLLAQVQNPSADLGCITAGIMQSGTGFVPSVFSGVQRSVKEFSLQPAGTASGSFNAAIFFTQAELAGVPANSLRLVQTTAATDAAMTSTNTQVVTPALVNGANYTGFQGSFTQFSRFFLTNGELPLSIGTPGLATGAIQLGSNPFDRELVLLTSLPASATAQIQLTDLSGRILFRTAAPIAAGSQQLLLPVLAPLAAGLYLLQVQTPGSSQTFKVQKR